MCHRISTEQREGLSVRETAPKLLELHRLFAPALRRKDCHHLAKSSNRGEGGFRRASCGMQQLLHKGAESAGIRCIMEHELGERFAGIERDTAPDERIWRNSHSR